MPGRGPSDVGIRPAKPSNGCRPSRRAVLSGAGALAATLGGLSPGDARAQQGTVTLPEAGMPFTEATVPDLARALAARPFAAPADDLPGALRTLSREQYEAIHIRPEALIWGGESLGYTVEPLHRGFAYTDRVALFLVEDGQVRPIPYDRQGFDPGGTTLPEPPRTDLAFSGIRIRSRFGEGDLADFALLQGACFFRVAGRGQAFGINARALMLRPADPRGEEFPRWRAFFVERPAGPDAPLVVHALIDSPSLSAALRLTMRPGDPSTVEIDNTVITRTALDHLGLGGAQATFLFGPYDRRGADDVRAAVYAVGGLQIRNGGDEALWRPVHNPETLQISSFLDDGPKGFGLIQRERDFARFEDDVQHWERRPSLWVEPGGVRDLDGLWGQGSVTLMEIPSDQEVNENVIAYWRPRAEIPARREFSFGYRQSWGWQVPEAPPVARVTGTRAGRGSTDPRRLFLVDFTGDRLFSGDGRPVPLDTVLSAGPGSATRRALYVDAGRRTVRVAFELDPGGERACELRLSLRSGGRPLTETWLYRWTP